MANVLLLSVAPENPLDDSAERGAYTRLKNCAQLGHTPHRLVDDPEQADIILYAEILPGRLCLKVRRHDYVKRYREKCFLFTALDMVVPFLPGVYASIEKHCYSPARCRSGNYLYNLENPYTEFDPNAPEPDLLYSFQGSVITAPVRSKMTEMKSERSVFIDTSKESLPILTSGTTEQRQVFWKSYAELIRRSKFVLCPRGRGVSSIRMFETMRTGRVPVIISDDWVPPEGPAWETFSIRVPESDVLQIPELLKKRESEAAAMGLKARAEWERWFSDKVVFDTVVNWCLDIKKARKYPEWIGHWSAYSEFSRSYFFREWLRSIVYGP